MFKKNRKSKIENSPSLQIAGYWHSNYVSHQSKPQTQTPEIQKLTRSRILDYKPYGSTPAGVATFSLITTKAETPAIRLHKAGKQRQHNPRSRNLWKKAENSENRENRERTQHTKRKGREGTARETQAGDASSWRGYSRVRQRSISRSHAMACKALLQRQYPAPIPPSTLAAASNTVHPLISWTHTEFHNCCSDIQAKFSCASAIVPICYAWKSR